LLLPIEWLTEGKVRYLDQTRLPGEEIWRETRDYREIAQAIRELQLRGAPLIGISAAYGLALAAFESEAADADGMRADLREAAAVLGSTRPTAVNLAWALDRTLTTLDVAATADEARALAVSTACAIHEEDIAANHAIGDYGAALLPTGTRVLTHCNAGSLATGGYGTALGVIRSAWEQGRLSAVLADETRPLLQGARLTAWELAQDGIPFTLIPDSAAGIAMRTGRVSAVVTGADRIAANGDVANKIGTYQVAVLARENGVPFYIAAPTSTIDLAAPGGDQISIEERSPDEVTTFGGHATAPDGAEAWNPAFDVTPHEFITSIVTENGVATPPYAESLRRVCGAGVGARG